MVKLKASCLQDTYDIAAGIAQIVAAGDLILLVGGLGAGKTAFAQGFGKEIGIKQSSAQITNHYGPASLIGKQVIAVTNLADKQIGPFISECLVTGFIKSDQSVILAVPDKPIANGTRLA